MDFLSLSQVYSRVITTVIKIIHTGESPPSQIKRAPAIGMMAVAHVIFALYAIRQSGAAIRATTAGRIPLKIASMAGWSL